MFDACTMLLMSLILCFCFLFRCSSRYDIAVLELPTPIEFSDNISKIKLPKPVTPDRDDLKSTLTSRFFDKGDCLILDWGATSVDDNTPFLQEQLKVAIVPLIGLDKCKRELNIFTPKTRNGLTSYLCTDTSICSEPRNDQSVICKGDSGGPIICGGVQVGVTSFTVAEGCAGPHIPGIYTRVDVCVKWIQDIMLGKNITELYMKNN